jgi:hypothetical protein
MHTSSLSQQLASRGVLEHVYITISLDKEALPSFNIVSLHERRSAPSLDHNLALSYPHYTNLRLFDI